MRAAWYLQNGAPDEVLVVGNLNTPEAGKNEVRVKIIASGVNPSDVKKRSGNSGNKLKDRIIPHSDGAGVIDQVGKSVDPERLGKRVWVYNAQFERNEGTAAEFVVLPNSQAIRLPESVSFLEGACLGIPAMTAHRCLFANGSIKNKTILVTGGAGAVGNYAIQLAKWVGSKVITTVSSEEKAVHAKNAGADFIINYKTEDVIKKIMEITNGLGVDRIVEVNFGSNIPVILKVLKTNGTVACYASDPIREPIIPFYPLMYKNVNIRFVLVYNMSDNAKLEASRDIGKALNEGKLIHKIDKTFPLEKIAEAHTAVEGGKNIGKIIIEI